MSVFTSRINGGNTYYGDYHNWTFVNPHVSGGGVGIPTTKISGKNTISTFQCRLKFTI